jgi:hypothetical protein
MKILKLIIIFMLAVLFCNHCDNTAEPPEEDDAQERLNNLLATYDQRFQWYLANAHQVMGKEILMYNALSDTTTIPKYMEINSSHYEYGFLVGLISQQYGRSPYRISTGQVEFNNQIINMYQRIYPQYLDIARGIGDAFDIPMNELDFAHLEYDFFINLWYSLFLYPEFRRLEGGSSTERVLTSNHCSMISAKINDNVFVGRNFDDSHEKPQFVVFTEMEGVYKVMANACYIPYHWVMDGVNEKGLYMGTANLNQPAEYYWSDPYPSVPAICEHHLFRIALETCATVDEVINLYSSVQPWSPNGTDHLMVVDALGNSAVVEFGLDRTVHFFRAEKYYQLMTNIAYQEGFDFMMANCWRFATGTQEAEIGINGFEDIERITRLIAGSYHGYTSFYDLGGRFMQLYRRKDFLTAYDFTCPQGNY